MFSAPLQIEKIFCGSVLPLSDLLPIMESIFFTTNEIEEEDC